MSSREIEMKNKILLLGNIKQDNSWSMKLYLEDLSKIDKRSKIFSPSSKVPLLFYKFFIYPFKIPWGYGGYHIIDHSYGNLAYFLSKKSLIITCHDLIPKIFPQEISFRGRILFEIYLGGLRKAKTIIVESKSTKRDLIKLLGINSNKIKVVTFPINLSKFYPIKGRIKKETVLEGKKVLLSVGRQFYKNTSLILKTLKSLLEKDANFFLVKVGSFSEKERKFIKENNLKQNILEKSNLGEEEMNEYYNLSNILIFPSLYEGFGKPPLEAMASGTPVIVSNASSLPEVVGNAALKVNPFSEKDLEDKILKIFNNPPLKRELIKKGFKNIKRFSFEKSKKEMEKIYSSFLKSSKNL